MSAKRPQVNICPKCGHADHFGCCGALVVYRTGETCHCGEREAAAKERAGRCHYSARSGGYFTGREP